MATHNGRFTTQRLTAVVVTALLLCGIVYVINRLFDTTAVERELRSLGVFNTLGLYSVVVGAEDLSRPNLPESDAKWRKAFSLMTPYGGPQHLNVEGLDVPVELIEQATVWRRLESIRFYNSYIPNRELSRLAPARRLRKVVVQNADLSDEGLGRIAAIGTLRHLLLSRVDVTDDGLERFRRQRPDVQLEVTLPRKSFERPAPPVVAPNPPAPSVPDVT